MISHSFKKQFVLIFGLLFAIELSAQFELGRKLVGLTIQNTYDEEFKYNTANSTITTIDKSNLFAIGGGYFIKNNISLDFSLIAISAESEIIEPGDLQQINLSGIGFSFASRIYAQSENRFKFFANPGISYLPNSGKIEQFSNGMLTNTGRIESFAFVLGIGGGFTYMLNNHLGLDVSIGNLGGYTYSMNKVTQAGQITYQKQKSESKINPITAGSFIFGVSFFF